MELIFSKWVSAFLLCCRLIFSVGHSVEGLHGNSRVRAVNLGGWLLVEGWIKPSHFDDIPNGDMLYISAQNGGGLNVSVDRDNPLEWETFKLRRVSESVFQFRTAQGQFLTCSGDGASVTATAESSSDSETFYLERNSNNRVHIKLKSGTYIQASNDNVLTADFRGTPGWDDNPATFEMTIVGKLQGDYQLANGYGHDKAKEVLKRHGINTVRIPVGWWIVSDTNPPAPFIGGSLEVLDNAFSWSQAYNLKCIIDLHAAPDSQNGMEHSASRDGTVNWQTSPEYVSQTLDVIEFLASRYAVHPALLGIELLNEASAADVSLDILNRQPQIQALNSANGPLVFVGEWVNEWNVTKLFLSGLPGFRKSSVRCV
ncbi:hypothetical protein K7X08_025677 [Anisodus acutangulus]|uniref:Mannan endo-1,4-beta-mannosidase n=1 Tax=Anisodus acutangulus TaxID=402998 RepID=A0A9Q1LVQ6_9SOLA|nr:hypothetical protein K7X08_025677 [Anisodus acutangulus]